MGGPVIRPGQWRARPLREKRGSKSLSGLEAQPKGSVAPTGPSTSQTTSSAASESPRGSPTVAYPTAKLLLHGYENRQTEEA